MRFFNSLLLAVVCFLFSPISLPAETEIKAQLADEYGSEIRYLKQEAKATSSDIEILRRDQINYKIEKDLLKEAYASNLQSINIVITIVLGVIGVLGYLGIRSIKDVKTDYVAELDNLKKLKIGFETELEILRNRQKQFEGQVSELTNINLEQNQRLKVLELIEKVGNLINSRSWQWALEYISIGLGLDSKNSILLSQKAACLGKLGELASSIETRKLLIEIEPNNKREILNLMEILALGNQVEEFNKLYNENTLIVEQEYSGNLIAYLKTILHLFNSDFEAAITELNKFIDKHTSVGGQLLGTWQFDEANIVISKLPDSRQKKLLVNTIQFFQGQIDAGSLKNILLEPEK